MKEIIQRILASHVPSRFIARAGTSALRILHFAVADIAAMAPELTPARRLPSYDWRYVRNR